MCLKLLSLGCELSAYEKKKSMRFFIRTHFSVVSLVVVKF